MMAKCAGHGGHRPGAGRPPSGRDDVAVKIDRAIVARVPGTSPKFGASRWRSISRRRSGPWSIGTLTRRYATGPRGPKGRIDEGWCGGPKGGKPHESATHRSLERETGRVGLLLAAGRTIKGAAKSSRVGDARFTIGSRTRPIGCSSPNSEAASSTVPSGGSPGPPTRPWASGQAAEG